MASWAAAEPKAEGAAPTPLDLVSDVEIDEEGVFKYVLISVSDKESGKSKHVVRGHSWAAYHDDVFQAAKADMRDMSARLQAVCVGGGRIRHEPAGRGAASKPPVADAAAIAAVAGHDPLNPVARAPSAAAGAGEHREAASGADAGGARDSAGHILVYGYSVGYGRADHALACTVLRRAYPTYHVEWSDDGY